MIHRGGRGPGNCGRRGGKIVPRPPVPASTVAPAITGSPSQGSTLTCSTGTWTNTPTSYAYQWLQDGATIVGATASTYASVAGDVGHTISCRVTATNANGSGSATAAGVGPISAVTSGSQTFSAAGPFSFTVPSSFNTLTVELQGGSGGTGNPDYSPGGPGGDTTWNGLTGAGGAGGTSTSAPGTVYTKVYSTGGVSGTISGTVGAGGSAGFGGVAGSLGHAKFTWS